MMQTEGSVKVDLNLVSGVPELLSGGSSGDGGGGSSSGHT